MPPIETLIAFFIATAIFAYMPGPGMLYASAQTLAKGTRAGMMAALGLHIGGYAHVVAAALGLALLFDLVPPLYVALKLVGACYLIWLGVQMLRTRKARIATDPDQAENSNQSPARAFRQSIVVEVLNPKTALFFMAFLPQFSDPTAALPIWAQLMILGSVVNIMFSSGDVICVILASRISRLVTQSSRATERVKALAGSVLIGLGLAVAIER